MIEGLRVGHKTTGALAAPTEQIMSIGIHIGDFDAGRAFETAPKAILNF